MDRKILEELVNQGLTLAKIAKQLNCSVSTIRYWLGVFELKTLRGLIKNKYFCLDCSTEDITRFSKGRYSLCNKCRNKFHIKKGRKYKTLAIEYKGGCCIHCGYNKCQAALQFHHRNPSEKDPKWSTMKNWTFESKKSELDKCDLVCANCHAEIHHTQKNLE